MSRGHLQFVGRICLVVPPEHGQSPAPIQGDTHVHHTGTTIVMCGLLQEAGLVEQMHLASGKKPLMSRGVQKLLAVVAQNLGSISFNVEGKRQTIE